MSTWTLYVIFSIRCIAIVLTAVLLKAFIKTYICCIKYRMKQDNIMGDEKKLSFREKLMFGFDILLCCISISPFLETLTSTNYEIDLENFYNEQRFLKAVILLTMLLRNVKFLHFVKYYSPVYSSCGKLLSSLAKIQFNKMFLVKTWFWRF